VPLSFVFPEFRKIGIKVRKWRIGPDRGIRIFKKFQKAAFRTDTRAIGWDRSLTGPPPAAVGGKSRRRVTALRRGARIMYLFGIAV
jgi:hypothetical protein